MAIFSPAFTNTLKHEGGFQENTADRGNYVCDISTGAWWAKSTANGFKCQNGATPSLVGTNWGIAAPTLAQFNNRVPTRLDMKSLSAFKAQDIYKAFFWDSVKLDLINDQDIANHMFDIVVNHSLNDGARIIQRAINKTGKSITEDGVIGSQTRNTINDLVNEGKKNQLNNNIVNERIAFYNKLVVINPSLKVFLKGWLSRAKAFFLSPLGVVGSLAVLTAGIIGLLLVRRKKNR